MTKKLINLRRLANAYLLPDTILEQVRLEEREKKRQNKVQLEIALIGFVFCIILFIMGGN